MNLALSFTILRILLSPLFPILYLGREWLNIPLPVLPYILLVILIISEFSDLFDGFFARKYNQVTDLGKLLDPLADSITHISLFLAFTQGFIDLPLMLVLVFLYRDFFITTLRALCALKGIALAARPSGKIKTFVQACAAFVIVVLMIPYTTGSLSLENLQLACTVVISIAAAGTLFSAMDYFYSNRVHIRKALKPAKNTY